jgi:tRNA A-37 threonylcarbamoyl transferase component Bud32
MLTEGTVVSGYRIESLVGEGGMATVYEAHQVSLNRVVALKIITRRLGDDPAFRERFRRECHIQAQLDHLNIVPIYEAGEGEHGLWLAMRLVRGPTLRELLLSERLSPERVLGILAPIAGALDVAHDSGLIHRDITPQNILIDERDHPYLSDFGITKGRGDRSLTRTGQFVGTLGYVAPEQIRDEPSVAATDTYALAAILFECLTGRVPFEKGTEAAVLYAHITEDPPAPTAIESSLPSSLDPVLRKGLAKRPGDRYPRATDLIAAAQEALATTPALPEDNGRAPGSATRPGSAKADRPRRRRGLALGAAALALAVVALAVGALTGTGSGSSPDPRRAANRDLSLDVPSGWTVARPGRSGVLGLPLADPVVLTPAGSGDGESVTVGRSAARGKTLLPPGLRPAAVGAASGTPVSLGSLQGLRYQDLRSPGSGESLTVFVVPASTGVATVACRPYRRGTEFAQLCQQLASSLRLTRGEAFPLGPSPRLEVALRRELADLNQQRGALREKLRNADGAAGQATAASELAAAFRHAARRLARPHVTPQSAAGLAALVAALRSTRDAYKSLASAARREDSGGFAGAKAAVSESEAAVDRRLRGLRPLGYRVAGAG